MSGHAAARPAVPAGGGLADLLLAGLVVPSDEDELLGDLVEGRATCAQKQGEATARRWYRRQVLGAVLPLFWHSLKARPWSVLLSVVGAWAVTALAGLALGLGGFFDSRSSPEPRAVLIGTLWRGAALLCAGAVGGAVAARLARGPRLVAVIVVAGSWALWAWEGPFYAVFGSAVQVGTDVYSVDLSATSHQLVLPAFWQMPAMAVGMPAMTMLGGLVAVAWLRRGARRGHATESRP